MDMALSEYIESRKIGVDGSMQNCLQNVQQSSQEQNGQRQQKQQARNNQQRNWQKYGQQNHQFGSFQRNSFKQNRQRNNQWNFQRNGQHGNQFNRNGFKNMNGSFDLRSKCGRQRQQNQSRARFTLQQQSNGEGRNCSNAANLTPLSSVGCKGVHDNQLPMFNLNQANQCQHHHAAITNSHMQCGSATQLQQLHQHQLPMQMYRSNAVLPCAMLQHQSIHSNNAIVPMAMNHNHVFGCQARSTCGGGGGGTIGGCLFNRPSPIVDAVSAISKLLSSNNASPLCLNVQLQPSRIAKDVEEMQLP